MPIVFYLSAILLLVFSLRRNRTVCFLDKDSSNVIKGFFILLIVFSHVLNAFPYDGFLSTPLDYFRGVLGQLIVSMFFFTSGYGIVFSIEKNNLYAKSIVTNRFLRILLYTVISLIPFFIYSACLKKAHPPIDYFLAIFGLASFGNASWFLFAILVCYASCSIVYLFNYKNRIVPVVLVSICIISYIFIMFFAKQPSHKWDTIICFCFGMFVGLFRNNIESFLSKKAIPYILMPVCIGVVIVLQLAASTTFGRVLPRIVEMWFSNFFFCVFFVCCTKVFVFRSRVLTFLGKASFAIFIMHLFSICCFTDLGTIPNQHLNYLVLFVSSVLIGIPFYFLYKCIDRWIVNPIVEYNRKWLSERQ